MWMLSIALSLTASGPPQGGDAREAVEGLTELTELVCMDCHRGQSDAEGAARIDLSAALAEPGEHLELLTTAFAQVRQGFMPPSDSAGGGFDADEQAEWLGGLQALIERDFPSAGDGERYPGTATIRRMTRRQLRRTLKRLLGLDVPVDRFLPRDASGYGFDTTGDTLFVTPLSFESWYECVEFVVEALDTADDEAPALRRLTTGWQGTDAQRRTAVEEFLELAFSRPPTNAEVEARLEIGRAAEGADGESPAGEIVRVTLLSPSFLYRDGPYRNGPDHNGPDRDGPHSGGAQSQGTAFRVDGWTFATRLSLFLHGARPGRALCDRAAAGGLATDAARAALVDELLESADAISLAEDFAAQWLGTSELTDVTPDVRRFRGFSHRLRSSMLAESTAFFDDLVRHDRSALECIDSEFVFVDRVLAKHYGMEGIQHKDVRRVKRTHPARGGVLGMAGVLTVTSNPLRTSPVKRGQWVLERLLHAPAPPPPPNVGTLSEDDQGEEKLTLRAQLEQHRASAACASCHDQMDPPGLALEAFDGIGKLREVAPGSLTVQLANGTSIEGPAGLKAALLESPERFLEAFASALFTYAVGRPPTLVDRIELSAAVDACRGHEYRVRTLLRGVALSTAMTHACVPVE